MSDSLGLYLHIPFCRRKCPYCDFYSLPAEDALLQAYTQKLCSFLQQADASLPVDTIYFGGGTPSLLSPQQISRILTTIESHFSLSQPEITLECNPATVTRDTLSAYRTLGINRLSIGVQSLSPQQLQRLGRLHTAEDALQTIADAQAAGFSNLSCDVMLALPNQTPQELECTLRSLAEQDIPHISAYLLKIEPHTPFAQQHMETMLPSEDAAADFYLQTVALLKEYGYAAYEISNFAKKGFESRHNCKYWRCEPYLGFGTAAHSCYEGKRFYVPRDLNAFLTAEHQPVCIEAEEACTPEEAIMLGLRLAEGIPLAWLNAEQIALLKRYAHAGLAVLTAETAALTPEGFLVSNAILGNLLA